MKNSFISLFPVECIGLQLLFHVISHPEKLFARWRTLDSLTGACGSK